MAAIPNNPKGPLRWIAAGLALAICGVAAFILWRTLHDLTPGLITAALSQIASRRLWLALMLTGASFAALGAYDVLAARLVAPQVPVWLAWLAGAAGNAVSNTLGFHAATGPLVRHRFYRHAGLGWATLGLGFAAMLAIALLAQGSWAGAGAILCLIGFLLFWLGLGGRRFDFARLVMPGAPMAAAQMVLGAAEMGAAIAALYVLMPSPPSFAAFAAAYIGAVLLGIVSHAPGGIGVFEATMLSLFGAQSRAGVLAALLLYRLIYNLLLFAAALLVMGGMEAAGRISSKADSAG
jgi:uncharacterized membrane protein YbhN (UPF0104 family)